MPKYSLIAKNIIDDKQTVLIPKQSLIEIDRFIYETFSDLEGVCKYFNVPPNSKLLIAYTYNHITRYLDLLFKHKYEFNLSSILKTANGSSINDQNEDFIKIFNQFMSVFTIDEINYLHNMGYINKRIYECKKCKNIIDRDLNASINIMFEGLKMYIKNNKRNILKSNISMIK